MKEICGDFYLTRKQKLQYILLNIPRGLFGYFVFLKSTHVAPTIPYEEITTESPTRHLLDRVFGQVIKESLLQKEIDVFDIGCGRGYTRDTLAEHGYRGTYTGIDMVHEPTYIAAHSAFTSTLIIDDITTYKTDKKFDLVMSMTVLEHVVDDFAAIQAAVGLVKEQGGVQIHGVPMFPTIFLYLWHGFRQYNTRRLKMLFGNAHAETTYYRVGGLASFFTHWWWITVPERLIGMGSLRRKFPNLYRKSLYLSFKIDRFLPFLATAYIIVKRSK